MFIGVIVGVVVLFGIAGMFGDVLKKAMEIVSLIAKLCIGGFISLLLYQVIPFETDSPWRMLIFVCVGAVVVLALILVLSGYYRLVGYSINYFINSFLVLVIAEMVGDKTEITFLMYALTLFLFPRIMWISDRFSTTTEYSHTEYTYWNDTETTYYNVKDMDWWEDFGDSWRHLPVQIAIASVFYGIGSLTIIGTCPISSGWLMALYLVAATAVNVVFDLFVFSRIDRTRE